MSVFDLKRSKELKALKLTREQISVRALEIAEQMIKHGGYKNAVACIGRMQTLGSSIHDSYWEEKRCIGKDLEYRWLVDGSIEDKERIVS